MAVTRIATLVAALLALAVAMPACAGQPVAAAAAATTPSSAPVLGVDASADLAEPQPAGLAARLVRPGEKSDKCSFVPSKNPLKPKRNACRFA